MDALLNDAPCGFLTFSDEGIISTTNTTLARLLGYDAGELAGRKFESLLTIAGRIFFQTHFFPLLSLHGKAEEIFLTLKAADGSEVPVLLNAKRRTDSGAGESHCVLMPVYQRKKFEEEIITAKRTAEEALTKNERLQQLTAELEKSKQDLDRQVGRLSHIHEDLARFSKIISHDMQEPARKIGLFADLVLREDSSQLSASGNMAVARIKAASERMTGLISSLQQYVSVDGYHSNPEPCDLNKIVESARERALAEKQDSLVVLQRDALPVVDGHCEQFGLLFYHLFNNSIQFKKEATPAEIRITSDVIQRNTFQNTQDKYRYADFARIVFSDRGQGFEKEYESYIFHLFEKAHSEAPGLGFGLALCKKIVENHYGSITAKSELGEGASFTILLPVKQLSAVA